MQRQIGYCTNVHAGTDLAQTKGNLQEHALAVKESFSPEQPMGIGLWLAAPAARQLLVENEIEHFREWLIEVGLVPFTFNGFPYGDFHQDIVKHDVYLPTWLDDARVEYTLDLIEIQHQLVTPQSEGSISTLPIAWGQPALTREQLERAAANFGRIAERLERLENDHGRLIYVCLESEPGCELQLSSDIGRFFRAYLLAGKDADRNRRYLRICHDVCHAAVMFEPQSEVFQAYREAGVLVGKVQISSAVVARFDQMADADKEKAVEQLTAFAEDRYLHQTVTRSSDGQMQFWEDLPTKLRSVKDTANLNDEWRIHFHVPVYLERFGLLDTSREQIFECLKAAAAISEVSHFEVETYAWSVLPRELQKERLATGIAEELSWFRGICE